MPTSAHQRSHDYDRIRKSYPSKVVTKISKSCSNHQHFLDVGTGTGILAFELLQYFKTGIGIDTSPERIKTAQTQKKTLGLARRVDYKVLSAEKTGYKAESFDLVTVAQAFHWLSKKQALKEFYRILKPGGTLVILWKYPNASTSLAKLANLCVPRLDRRDMKQQILETCLEGDFKRAGFALPELVQIQSKARYTALDWAKSITWAAGAGSAQMSPSLEEKYLQQLTSKVKQHAKNGVWETFENYLFIAKKPKS